jgi:hypothetical protein
LRDFLFLSVWNSAGGNGSIGETKRMKMQILKNVLIGGLVLTVTAVIAQAAPAQTKGGQLLMKQASPSNTTQVAPVKAHDCAQCKDLAKEVKLTSSKGAYQKTALVAEHACPTCDSKIRMEGQGKAARNIAVHTCANGISPSCCQ